MSAALSAIHNQPASNSKTNLLMGIGYFSSESAIALGVSHQVNSGIRMSTGIAYSGDKLMANLGVSLDIGSKESNRLENNQMSQDLKKIIELQQRKIQEQEEEINNIKLTLNKLLKSQN